jgi:putative NADH-flavin reductase
MKIVIFGASGKTGLLLTKQALAAGHEVIAFVRRSESIKQENENLKVVVGQLNDAAKIKSTITGSDVCVSTLGGNSLTKHATEFMEGIQNIIKAMEEEKVKRFIYMSSIGAGNSRALMAQPVRFFIADLMLRIPLADHTVNEQCIAQSTLNWTVVRPGGLTDGPLKTDIKHGSENVMIKGSPSISRASVAAFILRQIEDEIYTNKAVWVYE